MHKFANSQMSMCSAHIGSLNEVGDGSAITTFRKSKPIRNGHHLWD